MTAHTMTTMREKKVFKLYHTKILCLYLLLAFKVFSLLTAAPSTLVDVQSQFPKTNIFSPHDVYVLLIFRSSTLFSLCRKKEKTEAQPGEKFFLSYSNQMRIADSTLSSFEEMIFSLAMKNDICELFELF